MARIRSLAHFPDALIVSDPIKLMQGRQPCFKLNLRFSVPDMAVRVQASLRTGWYLRVVEPGTLAAADTIELLERPHPDYSIATLLALIRDRETDVSVWKTY